jgi:hypothetical protein
MMMTKAIGTHNRNCHSNKREGLGEEKKEGKKLCSTAEESAENDCADASVDAEELKWTEVRMSPYKQKREESLLFAAGEDGEATNHLSRELFSSEENIRSPEVTGTKRFEVSNQNFGNSTYSAYFNADINGSGVADIVALSQFGLLNTGKEIHPLDVQYIAQT